MASITAPLSTDELRNYGEQILHIAEAMNNIGFGHMWQTFITGDNPVGLLVFCTLVLFSFGSLYYMVVNIFRNLRIRSGTDRVITTFWETQNAQEATQFMEQQLKKYKEWFADVSHSFDRPGASP